MNKYIAFFTNAFKSQMVYHLATIMGFCVAVINLLIQLSLWTALIGSGVRRDVNLQEMIAFVMINAVVSALTRDNVANELGTEIQDGSVIMHFIRPISFRLYLFSALLGKNLYYVLTSALPVVIFSCFFIGFPLAQSPVYALLFLILTLLGIIIMFQLIYIVGLLAFWTQATWYLSWYLRAGVTFFGGTLIPLWFYPKVLEKLSMFLPFRYITFEAINYGLGKAPLSHASQSLGMAMFWAVLLFLIGHLIWKRVQQRMTINGG